MKTKNIAEIVKHYLHAALWTEELDSFDLEDIHANSVAQATEDCKSFVEKAGSLLNEINEEQIGHDFWLTRNGHGAGFWDRGLGEVGDKLTEICKEFKGKDVFAPESAGDKISIE
jgi:hypothetical protein